MHEAFVFLTAVSLISGVCGLEVLAEGQRSFRDARVPWKMSIGSENMGGQSSLAIGVNGRIIRNFRGTYLESRLNGISPTVATCGFSAMATEIMFPSGMWQPPGNSPTWAMPANKGRLGFRCATISSKAWRWCHG